MASDGAELRRFSLVVVGMALLAFDLGVRLVGPLPPFGDPPEILATWTIAAAVAALGVRAARRHDPAAVWRQARTTAVVAIVAVPFGVAGAGLLVADGLPGPESAAVVPFAAATGGFLGAVVGEYERRSRAATAVLEALHGATREMVAAGDPEAVCERAVEAATEALGAELVGVWLVDETGTRLVPVAESDASAAVLDELPTYTAAETSISWSAFESGELRVVADVGETPDAHDSDSPIRSEVVVPLGEFGVMNVGSTTAGAFDDTDVYFIRLLAGNVTSSLAGARRERALRTRTDQMEFFTSVLRHDVRNGIGVVRGRAELLADRLAGEDADDAETILRWADEMSDVIDRVSEVLATLATDDDRTRVVDLSAVVREACDRIEDTYPGVTLERTLPGRAPILADSLISEVVGNLLSNAVTHNDPEGLVVSATVRVDDGQVFLRVADNGRGIPAERREAVFRRGESTADSGFGLFFVDAMISAYGGEVWAEASETGGAAFVVRLPTAEEPA